MTDTSLTITLGADLPCTAERLMRLLEGYVVQITFHGATASLDDVLVGAVFGDTVLVAKRPFNGDAQAISIDSIKSIHVV